MKSLRTSGLGGRWSRFRVARCATRSLGRRSIARSSVLGGGGLSGPGTRNERFSDAMLK